MPSERTQQLLDEAWERYQEQVKLVKGLRAKWVKLGRPMTTKGGATGRVDVVHPLVREIQEAETLADRLSKSCLEKRPVGRPRGSQSAADRQSGTSSSENGTSGRSTRIRRIAA